MATASVKTTQFVDPRIEPMPDPVYDYVIAPQQNQFYELNASSTSDSFVAFNNLTTLGTDRAYLDTFELEITAEITFHTNKLMLGYAHTVGQETTYDPVAGAVNIVYPTMEDFTFDSFPFNKCISQAKINVNGGAFFSQPQQYLRAKERYMNQYALSKSYQNVTPCHRAECQYESARTYGYTTWSRNETLSLYNKQDTNIGQGFPTRYGLGQSGWMQSKEGWESGSNNSCIDIVNIDCKANGDTVYTVRWREPIFCTPFSSRYDATYGRPLYNITSLDITFELQSLGNMIRVASLGSSKSTEFLKTYNQGAASHTTAALLPTSGSTVNLMCTGYDVSISKSNVPVLRYQVLTIPPTLNKPLTTLIPYRRFVPYITAQTGNIPRDPASNRNGGRVTMRSGVYTLNEIPTAIWVFVAPVLSRYQDNLPDNNLTHNTAGTDYNDDTTALNMGNWDSNKLFGTIEKISISLANTTQILERATPYDLYRICKANGLEDSWYSFYSSGNCLQPNCLTYRSYEFTNDKGVIAGSGPAPTNEYRMWATLSRYWGNNYAQYDKRFYGAGSVLRLKPGVDLVVPDQPLIPGANANNMVFQVSDCIANIPPQSSAQQEYALWLLFEYVGVAAISPGQCEITMNPLGTGEIMASSPVMSATSATSEGELETGSGFWDRANKFVEVASHIAKEGVISKILKMIPGLQQAGDWAEKHGLGEPPSKRQCNGGAVIGHGLNEWI